MRFGFSFSVVCMMYVMFMCVYLNNVVECQSKD